MEQNVGAVAPNPERELTFGEQAVGLSFNPSQDRRSTPARPASRTSSTR